MSNKNNDANLSKELNMALQKEINSFKVNVDRSIFKKTAEEKEKLKLAKAQYKLSIKNS